MDFDRKINVVGEIDDTSYRDFVVRMDEIEEICEEGDIHIELSSDGGSAAVALAFYDRIRRCPCNVIITAYGMVASAAVLILAAGDNRLMSRNGWVMVHEDTTLVSEDMRVSEIEKNAKISRRLEDQWNRLLASRTKISAKAWEALHKEESYLSADECLELGLVDKII